MWRYLIRQTVLFKGHLRETGKKICGSKVIPINSRAGRFVQIVYTKTRLMH